MSAASWLLPAAAVADVRLHSIDPGATQGEAITANGDLHQFRIALTKADPPQSTVVRGTTYWKVNEDANHYYSSTVQWVLPGGLTAHPAWAQWGETEPIANDLARRFEITTQDPQLVQNNLGYLITVKGKWALVSPTDHSEQFLYGADGLRRRKEVDSATSTTTSYIWDGPNLLQEANAQDETTAQYTGFPDRWGRLVSQWRTPASDAAPRPVARWEDRSGGNNDATQSAAAQRPRWVPNVLNGEPVVHFDGGQELGLPAIAQAAPSEIYIVYKPNTGASLFNAVGFNASKNKGTGSGSGLLLGADDEDAPEVLSGLDTVADQPSVRWGGEYSFDTALVGWHIVRFRLGASDIGIAVDGGTEQTFSHGASILDV